MSKLEQDVRELMEYINQAQGRDEIPVKKYETVVFDNKPLPTQDTFRKSAFFKPQSTYMDALVLYAPTLEHFYTIDNSSSDVEVSYSESITTGFNFGITEELAVGAEFEFNAIFMKGTVSVNVTLGFSQEWTESYTETISLTVPGRKMGYLYRGVMKAAILRMDLEEGSFRYLSKNTGLYESDIIKTTDTIIV